MTFALLKAKIDAIGADLGYRQAVALDADVFLRHAIAARNDGRMPDTWTYWTEALDADFAKAAEQLEAEFTEHTQERVQGLGRYQGRKVVHRVTGIWLEGASYRARLSRCWSYHPAEGGDLKWAANVTDFGRRIIGVRRYGLTKTDRARLERDCPSEYLAERAMKDLFETNFRVELSP